MSIDLYWRGYNTWMTRSIVYSLTSLHWMFPNVQTSPQKYRSVDSSGRFEHGFALMKVFVLQETKNKTSYKYITSFFCWLYLGSTRHVYWFECKCIHMSLFSIPMKRDYPYKCIVSCRKRYLLWSVRRPVALSELLFTVKHFFFYCINNILLLCWCFHL